MPEKGGSDLFLAPIAHPQVNWITGPRQVSLGIADMEIPDGYRVIGARDARALLASTKNPVPKGLIGILASPSGDWWAVLEYTAVGYVKDPAKEQLDSGAILDAIRNQSNLENQGRKQQGLASVVSVDWERQPAYNAGSHLLEWAVEAQTQTARTINYTVMLLGRNGVLEITAIQPYQPTASLPPLKEIAEGIAFNDGQRYGDYQNGDKLAGASLASLIVDDNRAAATGTMAASIGHGAIAWGLFLLTACVAGGGVLLTWRVRRVRQALPANGHNGAAAAASAAHQNGGSNGNGNGAHGLRLALQNVAGNSGNGGNGANGSKSRRAGRMQGKRVFDYAKFYTDFVMMSHSNAHEGLVINRKSRNGHDGMTPAASQNGSDPAAASVNSELIASQKALIEEQKRLIEQQTRFIWEKNKLIEEQNQFLERQTAMIENQYSLKLE